MVATCADRAFAFDLSFNKRDILSNVLMVSGEVADITVDLVGIVLTTILQEPYGRLLDERKQQGEKTSGDKLDGHCSHVGQNLLCQFSVARLTWNPPRLGIVTIDVVDNAIIDPTATVSDCERDVERV